jgi:hypothetical protein
MAKVPPLLSQSSRGIGDSRAMFLGLFHSLLDVFDRDVGPHDRVLVCGEGLSDAHQSPTCSSRNSEVPEIGV